MTTSITEQESSIGITVKNPRSGDVLYTIPEPTDEDVRQVYERARRAFTTLGAMPIRARLDELGKLKKYILDNREHLVTRICEETGKCRTDALAIEVFPACDIIDYYQKNAEKLLADQVVKTPMVLFGKKSRIYYEPLGVVLVISPWNYPFHLSFVPIVCALAAGNAVILKPSRYTPLRGVLEDMCEKSGFVPNALQVVYATRKTAGALIEAPPAKIFFTGSVDGGRQVMAQAARHLTPVELELGGKDPMIVFEDVDLNRAANGAMWGGIVNCGQTCTAVERIYVHEGIYDRFIDVLKEKVQRLRTLQTQQGEENLDVGCMTTEFQIQTIEGQLEDARAKGARIVCGGSREPGSHVFPPTIVADATHSMSITLEETFGPVVTVTRFRTEDEAVELANDSPFGLSSSVWSADIERATRVARRLVTGNVSINNVLATQASSALPFGGAKQSGFGRYRGVFGLHTFSNIKAVVIDRQSGKSEMHWYPYSRLKYSLLGKLMEALFNGGPLGIVKAAWYGLRLELLARKERL